MKIWLVQIGEPLPIDDQGQARLFRTGILAEVLLSRGHKVLWWTADFYHQKKRVRFGQDKELTLDNGLELQLISGLPYKKNISFKRILNHVQLGCKFSRLLEKRPAPDLVLASYPAIELAWAAVRYGRYQGIPVVLDVRDLWPDIFLDFFPGRTKWLARFLLGPYFWLARQTFAQAAGITGITDEFVRFGLSYARRSWSDRDRTFPMAYQPLKWDDQAIQGAKEWWSSQGVGPGQFIVCFLGTFTSQRDLKTVIAAAHLVGDPEIRFVLCGQGDQLPELRDLAGADSRIVFPGWVDGPRICALLEMADLGLAPYVPSANFLQNIPNKPVEYWSFGLPVLSSIQGKLGKALEEYGCGLVYEGAEDLAAKVVELKNNPGVCQEMSVQAKGLFAEKYDARQVYKEFARYLEGLV